MSNNAAARRLALVCLAGIIVLVSYLMANVNVVSDIRQFMPRSTEDTTLQTLQGELQTGPVATMLLLSSQGGAQEDQIPLSRDLRQAIESSDSVIESIQNGEVTAYAAMFDKLQPYRYLLTDQNWSVEGLHSALQARQSDLRAGAGPVIGRIILSDPYMAITGYLKSITGKAGPEMREGIWLDKETGALLMARVKGDVLDLDTMEEAVRHLRSEFAQLTPVKGVRLMIAGPGMMAVETRAAIQETIQQISWVLSGLLVGVFWLAYRSIRLLLLACVPLLSASVVGMFLTQLLFGEVHGVVIAFGITLLGICLDYPLHLFSHRRQTESAHESIDRIWPTLRLGGVSSALAFFTLMGTGFDGLSQLAVFAASGLLVALWLTRYVLPYWVEMLQIRPRYIKLKQRLPLAWRSVIVLLLLLIPAWGWFSADSLWGNIDSISPVPAQARQMDGLLRKAMGAEDISHVFVVQADSREEVLRNTEYLTERLEPLVHDKIVGQIVPVTRLLPSMLKQKSRQARIPPRPVLAERITKAAKNTSFRNDAFSSFLDDAEKARSQTVLLDGNVDQTELNNLIKQGLVELQSGWLSVIRLVGLTSDEALLDWLKLRPEIARHHVQLKKAVSELLQSYREAALQRAAFAFILLSVLVWLGIREKRRWLRIMFPVGLSVLASLSVPLITGHGLTIFHLLAAMLVMGMGLDYSLFFNRQQNIEGEHMHSIHAIGISMLTTVVSFSVLAASSVPVMAAMGSVIAVGIILCFLLGWLMSNGEMVEWAK